MEWFHMETGLLIQGTLAAMLIAYMTRFLAVSHSPIDSAMQRITGSIDEAAMGLGSKWLVDFATGSLAHTKRRPVHRRHTGVR